MSMLQQKRAAFQRIQGIQPLYCQSCTILVENIYFDVITKKSNRPVPICYNCIDEKQISPIIEIGVLVATSLVIALPFFVVGILGYWSIHLVGMGILGGAFIVVFLGIPITAVYTAKIVTNHLDTAMYLTQIHKRQRIVGDRLSL